MVSGKIIIILALIAIVISAFTTYEVIEKADNIPFSTNEESGGQIEMNVIKSSGGQIGLEVVNPDDNR